jgi:hypothetical protein
MLLLLLLLLLLLRKCEAVGVPCCKYASMLLLLVDDVT